MNSRDILRERAQEISCQAENWQVNNAFFDQWIAWWETAAWFQVTTDQHGYLIRFHIDRLLVAFKQRNSDKVHHAGRDLWDALWLTPKQVEAWHEAQAAPDKQGSSTDWTPRF